MALQSTTLRPGLLVSLKTSLTGNIRYEKRTIETERVDEQGRARAQWETTKFISDAAEHEAATKARSKAATLVRAVCAQSAFGLLCPESDADKLGEAFEAARAVTAEFNAQARLSRIGVYIITGRIAPDDVQAVKAINSEISELMEKMVDGVRNVDVKAVRDAASRAKEVGAMLPAETAARVQLAIDAARSAARQMVKAGEAAAQEIDLAAIRRITEARTAFLDLDDAKAVQRPAEQGTAIDLEPEPVIYETAPASTIAMEF